MTTAVSFNQIRSVLIQRYDLLTGEPLPAQGGSGLARFWQLRGRTVIEAGGILWGAHHGPLYQSLPYQLQLAPAAGEMEALLGSTHIPAVRFPSTQRAGVPCGFYVCRSKNYSLRSVCRKQRGHVNTGLEQWEIRPVDPDELLAQGLELNLQTMQRHQRFDAEFGQPERWKKFVHALRECPELKVTGAWVKGRLASYVIACQEDGWLHLLYKNTRTSDLPLFVNHALDVSILCAAAADPLVHAVGNYYAGSLTHAGLDQYKRQIGFTPIPHNLCVHVNSKFATVLVNAPALSAVRAMHALRPGAGSLESGVRLLENAMITRNDYASEKATAEQPCQHEDGLTYSRTRRPHWVFQIWWYARKIKREGIVQSLRKIPHFVSVRTVNRVQHKKPAPYVPEESLGLQPGEWVEIKSEAEILATLGKNGKSRGLLFTKEMRKYYGWRTRVFKRVERIFMEESKQNRSIKNTVLLEGMYCQGLDLECDKCCFLFWKEAWLRRVDGPAPETRTRKS